MNLTLTPQDIDAIAIRTAEIVVERMTTEQVVFKSAADVLRHFGYSANYYKKIDKLIRNKAIAAVNGGYKLLKSK